MYRLQAGDKPIDFGHGGITGCLTHHGRIIALHRYHPVHGYITLSSLPPFPDIARYDQAQVRAYRRKMLETKGIGLRLDDVVGAQVEFSADDAPILHLRLADNVRATCTTQVIAPHGIIQHWQFSAMTHIRFDGTGYLMRHPYPQLTEGGVLTPIPSDVTDFLFTTANGRGYGVYNEALGVVAGFAGADFSGMPSKSGFRVHYQSHGDALTVYIAFADAPADTSAFSPSDALADIFTSPLNPLSKTERGLDTHHEGGFSSAEGMRSDPLEHRAHAYARLCAMPSADETVCILTDHMILPLSWNRDAYYTARLWLTNPHTYDLVRRHLLWMFRTAERIDGLWGRSYLANGQVKDKGFQLDQQLFPLLELADYVQITGDKALVDDLRAYIAPVLSALEAHRAPHAPLYATDETPADDPIALPYPLSSQILLWHTLRQLAKVGVASPATLSTTTIAQAIRENFIATPPNADAPIYAYATDGAGHHHFYHDANDIPLVLMPAWGFCDAQDAVWRATIDFAFSDANIGGFYDGVLGSVHTPAPWALGDLQEWIVARTLDDTARAERVLARVHHAMGWDGALSEAYNAQTGAVVSRHWFLWTNALYACIKRGMFDILR